MDSSNYSNDSDTSISGQGDGLWPFRPTAWERLRHEGELFESPPPPPEMLAAMEQWRVNEDRARAKTISFGVNGVSGGTFMAVGPGFAEHTGSVVCEYDYASFETRLLSLLRVPTELLNSNRHSRPLSASPRPRNRKEQRILRSLSSAQFQKAMDKTTKEHGPRESDPAWDAKFWEMLEKPKHKPPEQTRKRR